jgi:hypothetical protein
MEISVEYNSDFKYDLKEGKLKGETKFHKMLSNSKIEVKFDRMTRKTGNVYIEYESRGNPSGIRTTEADYWAYFTQDEECFVISTKKLKEKIIKLKPRKIKGGDNNSSMGFLIKLTDLIGV